MASKTGQKCNKTDKKKLDEAKKKERNGFKFKSIRCNDAIICAVVAEKKIVCLHIHSSLFFMYMLSTYARRSHI